jgi:hypothetical protein
MFTIYGTKYKVVSSSRRRKHIAIIIVNKSLNLYTSITTRRSPPGAVTPPAKADVINRTCPRPNDMKKFTLFCRILSFLLAGMPIASQASNYWVTKDGRDSNPCTLVEPCLTIQRGVHTLSAGDTLNITAGTYKETASLPDGTPISYFTRPAGIVLINSGTAIDPIVVQAAPDHEGLVIIDQNYENTGFYFNNSTQYAWPDFIHIKNLIFQRCLFSCISSHDNPNGLASDADSLVSRGVLIEGNQMYETAVNALGVNSAAIRMDSSRDWVIRDNIIDGVRYTSSGYENPTYSYDQNSGGIEAYNVYGSLVENNEIRNVHTAVYWKDTANNPPAYPNVQSTVRFNKIDNVNIGVELHAGAAGDTTGYHIVSNNIFKNIYTAVYMEGSQQEGRINFRHNFINYGNFGPINNQSQGIGIASSDISMISTNKIIEATGNIFYGNNYRNYYFSDNTNYTNILNINYNIYSESVSAYIWGGNNYNNLAQWQSANHPQILDTDQGVNSQEDQAISKLAKNIATDDFMLPVNSPALNFMPNGDNAGPYQKGSEVIGRISDGPPTPNPPSDLEAL